MQDRSFNPTLVFDITDTIELKEKAILAFSSQFNVTNPGNEPETYISSSAFFRGPARPGNAFRTYDWCSLWRTLSVSRGTSSGRRNGFSVPSQTGTLI